MSSEKLHCWRGGAAGAVELEPPQGKGGVASPSLPPGPHIHDPLHIGFCLENLSNFLSTSSDRHGTKRRKPIMKSMFESTPLQQAS